MSAWFEGQVECPSCHKGTRPGKFCGECGKPLPGSEVRCGRCNAAVSATATFCGQCGASLAESTAPAVMGNRWARRADDFATRVDVNDVEGFFTKGLIVEEGTKAIFITNGAFSGIVEAGRHDLGGLKRTILNVFSSKKTTAVLIDTGDVEVSFSLDGLRTADPLQLSADCRVVLRLDNPVPFFENLLKGQQSYSLTSMRAFIAEELRNAGQEFLSGRTVADLSGNLAVKQALEQGIATHLGRTLERKGLTLVQVRVFDFRHAKLNALTGKLEEYWLDAEELRTRLKGGEMLAGVERRVLDQETQRALMQVEVFEERARVYQRMRTAANSEEINKISTADDLEKFVHGIDKGRLIRGKELEDLKADFADRTVDRAVARQHLLATLEVNHTAEVERLKLIGKLSLQSTVGEAMRSEELKQFDVDLEKQRREYELRRQQRRGDLEDQDDEVGKATKWLRDLKAVKAEEADRDQKRELDAERERHARELEKYQKLADLGPDALISFGPADRAPILAELRKTEMLKGMTDSQILAMAAEKSGAVADALKEKFKGEAGREVMERLILEKDRHAQQSHEAMRANAEQLERLATRAMDTMRDTAAAATRAGQPGMTVITPGMSSGIVQTGAGGQMGGPMKCPTCRSDVPASQNFCQNCGHKFLP